MLDKTTHFSSDHTDFSSNGGITAEYVCHLLERLESQFIKAQSRSIKIIHPDVRGSFEQTQQMLNFARDNYEKGFLNVSNSCLKLAENYLKKCD